MTKKTLQNNEFNKGVALFWSAVITVCISLLGVGLNYVLPIKMNSIVTLIIAIISFFYAKKMGLKATTHEDGIAMGPWGYFVFILFLNELGMLLFFYDIQKIRAKRKGQNVDGKKGILFTALIVLLMTPFIWTLMNGVIAGYNLQKMKYQQQEFQQRYLK